MVVQAYEYNDHILLALFIGMAILIPALMVLFDNGKMKKK